MNQQPPAAQAPGTIPANTGRITTLLPTPTTPWDHPREYGENFRGSREELHQLGPSPRIRGEFNKRFNLFKWGRTIPANTGRIRTRIYQPERCRDHPREYGENAGMLIVTFSPLGPSPRIRGECILCLKLRQGIGTIPANTGRMYRAVTKGKGLRDHPREYGENWELRWPQSVYVGPSPRIRGEYRG